MDTTPMIRRDTPGRALAFRDIQEGLYLEGSRLVLTGFTVLEVISVADGLPGSIPSHLGDLIDQWEPDLVETMREDTPQEIYAAGKRESRLDRAFRNSQRPEKPLTSLPAYSDPFTEKKPQPTPAAKPKSQNSFF